MHHNEALEHFHAVQELAAFLPGDQNLACNVCMASESTCTIGQSNGEAHRDFSTLWFIRPKSMSRTSLSVAAHASAVGVPPNNADKSRSRTQNQTQNKIQTWESSQQNSHVTQRDSRTTPRNTSLRPLRLPHNCPVRYIVPHSERVTSAWRALARRDSAWRFRFTRSPPPTRGPPPS